MMDRTERVVRAITFRNPDRIPILHTYLPGALLRHKERLLDIYRRYPDDFQPISRFKIPQSEKEYYRPDGTFYKEETDEWGCVWAYYQEGITGQVIKHPLADWSHLKKWHPPRPRLSTEEERDEVVKLWTGEMRGYPLWGGGSNFFERMHYLRGYQNLLYDLAEDRKEVYDLADKILYEYIIPTVENHFKTGLKFHIIGFSDDWGTQQALMINPKLWRKIFKPRYQKMFELCHRNGSYTYFHSDGMILEIVPDLIEIGLDCLNPQFSCLDLKRLKEVAGENLCISTDIDRQNILPFATPEAVRQYVKQVYDIFGSQKGGLIWRSEVGPDVPLENVEAMVKAFYDYR